MKKLCALLLAGCVANGFAYDLLYTLGSTPNALDGDLHLTIQNTKAERIVMNKLQVVNEDGKVCTLAGDFIIEPKATMQLAPFNQNLCFGIDNKLVLDSAFQPTDAVLNGETKEDFRIQTQYTVGMQPDPYSTNIGYTLYFK